MTGQGQNYPRWAPRTVPALSDLNEAPSADSATAQGYVVVRQRPQMGVDLHPAGQSYLRSS